MKNSPRGILFNKTRCLDFHWWNLYKAGVEEVLKGSMGDGSLRGCPWGLDALEHVGKTISYSQMLSGHCSSYAWTSQGYANTQLRKALGLRI